MADEDKAKAEKLAAAKKRVEALKKKSKKAGSSASKKEDTPEVSSTPEPATEAFPPPPADDAAQMTADGEGGGEAESEEASPVPPLPSLSQQSKARSTSFRHGPLSPGLFSPEGETAPDIYRKHVGRIEELEKENKRLEKEAQDAERRWQKAEGELADLREGESTNGEQEKLKNEILSLQRQNAQLQSQLSRPSGARGHGSSPSISIPSTAELEHQLSSKSATIETMELEMSRLRAQAERLAVSASTPSEQITALEEKLARAEKAAALAQRELADLKKGLDRASEKAIKEGSARTSAETKVRTLEKENEELKAECDELSKKVEALDKKVGALTTLHKEQDGRTQALRKDKERVDKELIELKEKLEVVEAENLKLSKKDVQGGSGLAADDEGIDELEDEERKKLEKRVRELEAENMDLRRGVWVEKRREMQVGPDEASGLGFENVDLGSAKKATGGFGDLLATGLNVLTGGVTGGHGHGHHHSHSQDDGLLLDDDEFEFDEEAFRKAQEEDQKKRLERIKDIKRGLKNWEGWRLDLVENRRGGGEGIGEIFEV
ncbi:hypothetical protein QBC38DRAFT_486770 [Podospora fimiseda]|uniref:M protein repeat protein n=1 Tax=Podospora fimiseda TaxID=252190 RepID=A0AAN7BIH8_9PEZI|nr:hypothetical protein QBC38DRAFT_486770 [Podospora fimiseda]